MSEYVWVSDALNQVATLGLNVEVQFSKPQEDFEFDGVQLNNAGMPIAREQCPIRIQSTDDDLDLVPTSIDIKVPELFLANGHVIVSQRVAEEISKVDLGAGALHPVTEGVFRSDGTTQIDDEFHCWSFGNQKSVFLPDETPEKDTFGGTGLIWNLPWTMRDDNIAVSSKALEGPAVWIDTGLFKAFFVSRELGDALDQKGLRKALRLFRARVI